MSRKQKSVRKKSSRRKRGPSAAVEFASTSSYYKGSDIKEPFEAPITGVEREDFDDGPKWVLSLKDHEKTVVLNKTNGRALAEDLGDSLDDWVGQSIRIFTERRNNPTTGKMGPAITVSGVVDEEDSEDFLDDEDDSELE